LRHHEEGPGLVDAHGVLDFHDYKVSELSARHWSSGSRRCWGITAQSRRRTFRKLPDAAKTNLDQRKAIMLMLEQPSMIKRPVLERGKSLLVGFDPERYSGLL
jgi:arsenate reductase-like glutaredoxin family protein